MNQVKETKKEIIITKFGVPVAKLVPIKKKKSESAFGKFKNSIQILGDVVSPINEEWNVLKEPK